MTVRTLACCNRRLLPVIGSLIKQNLFRTNHIHRCNHGNRITNRKFSSSLIALQQLVPPEGDTVLTQGHHAIDQFGCVKIHGSAQIEISPNLDPKDYREGMAMVHYCVCSRDGRGPPSTPHLHAHYDRETKSISFDCSQKENEALMKYIFKLPIKADLNLQLLGENDIRIRGMESEVVSIKNQAGLCHLTDNKCSRVDVNNGRGDIHCAGVLQGQINLTTSHEGHITTDRLQGSLVSLRTEAGYMNIKSIYAEKADLTTRTGDIHIRNCQHRTKVDINEDGNLKIDSLDGSLLAFIVKGNTDVFISRQERVLIRTREGNITLRVPEDHVASVDLHGDRVVVHKDIHLTDSIEEDDSGKFKLTGEMNGNEEEIPSSINHKGNYHVLHAETNHGDISLLCQDWFSTLNLDSSVTEKA